MNARLLPEQASRFAEQSDALSLALLGVTVFFTLGILVVVAGFCLKYRRRAHRRTTPISDCLKLELLWTGAALLISMVLFVWGAVLYARTRAAPADAMPLYVVGKQWMWKVQHPQGRREINELHVPRGQPIELIMTSQDVIHSFFVPAFRLKMDVLPDRFTRLWFQPTRTGRFHLFCAEYCGTRHSQMSGTVVVMEPADYQRWLSADPGLPEGTSTGAQLFARLGCAACHNRQSGHRGPDLTGLYGRTVHLQSGTEVVADEDYLREAILDPHARMVQGYQAIMPTYAHLIDGEQLVALIEYIKSLGRQDLQP